MLTLGKGKYNTLTATSHALFQVLKDHNNREAINMAIDSHYYSVKKAAFKQGIVLPEVLNVGDTDIEEPITNLVLCPSLPDDIRRDVLKGVRDLEFTRIDMKVIGETEVGKN